MPAGIYFSSDEKEEQTYAQITHILILFPVNLESPVDVSLWAVCGFLQHFQEIHAKRAGAHPCIDESDALMLGKSISHYVKLFAKRKTHTSRF